MHFWTKTRMMILLALDKQLDEWNFILKSACFWTQFDKSSRLNAMWLASPSSSRSEFLKLSGRYTEYLEFNARILFFAENCKEISGKTGKVNPLKLVSLKKTEPQKLSVSPRWDCLSLQSQLLFNTETLGENSKSPHRETPKVTLVIKDSRRE